MTRWKSSGIFRNMMVQIKGEGIMNEFKTRREMAKRNLSGNEIDVLMF